MKTKLEKIQLLKDMLAGTASIEDVVFANRQIKAEVVVISSFYEHLKFSNTIGRKETDFDNVIITPGEYRDALLKMNAGTNN